MLTAGAAAQTKQPDSNVACVERLQIPAYPALANAARIEGTITAAVRLSPQSSIERITSEVSAPSTRNAQPMLTSAVERTIRDAKFRADCAGKAVTLVFEFKLVTDGVDEKHFFEPPNKFLILSKPIRIETNP